MAAIKRKNDGCCFNQSKPDTKVIFRNVNILDSTGKEPYPGDVLVHGKRIISVGPKVQDKDVEDARVIEGKGRTLMSGLGSHDLPFSSCNITQVPDHS